MKFYNYLITDPKYYTDDKDIFKEKFEKVLKYNQVDIASFRDKLSTNKIELAKTFMEICKNFNIEKTIINSDIDLALELNSFGVHLSSKQFDKITLSKENNLFVIISCHDFEEVKKAYELGADAITYSPIYYTPFKGKPKGLESLKVLVDKFRDLKDREFKIFALGGIITDTQIEDIKKVKSDGFASIRYFIED